MPRYARVHVTGGLFHIISRFHDRRFYLDIDGARGKYLELVGKAMESHDARIVAYCLMSSHVHLVLQLGNDPVGKLTKKIHAPFANWINSQRGGNGVVMADRPKSVLVHSDTYGMELIRYVHNNPVRAGVVERACESNWSSHRAYLGLESSPPWLATDAVFGPNAGEHETIRHELACFVDGGRQEKRRPEFSGEVSKQLARRLRKLLGGDVELSYPVLGPDDFVVNALKGQAARHRERQQLDIAKVDAKTLVRTMFEALGLDPALARKRVKTSKVARGRALVCWTWVERFGWPQVSICEALGVRPCTVSSMLSAMRRDGMSQEEADLITEVSNSLSRDETAETTNTDSQVVSSTVAPSVFVLRRNRGMPV